MMYRLTLAIAIVATAATMAEAQSGSRVPLPAVPQVQPQPQPRQFVQPQARQAAPQFQGQPRIPGQGAFSPQQPYYGNGYNPLIGSGLPDAQKDGCNCFQLPPYNPNPPYDPYASRNYWDLCPPCGQGTPRAGCSAPKWDFNRFIPRPTRGYFNRPNF